MPEVAAKKVGSLWKTELQKLGWQIGTETTGPIKHLVDFTACRGNLRLAAMVTGSDRRLKFTQVTDFCRLARMVKLEPLFIQGESADPMVLNEVHVRRAILLSYEEFGNLETALTGLPSTAIGFVESIRRSGTISGWAMLSPTPNKATVLAYLNDVVVGKSTANSFRADLAAKGYGDCAFVIATPAVAELTEFPSTLVVRVYDGKDYVSNIKILTKELS